MDDDDHAAGREYGRMDHDYDDMMLSLNSHVSAVVGQVFELASCDRAVRQKRQNFSTSLRKDAAGGLTTDPPNGVTAQAGEHPRMGAIFTRSREVEGGMTCREVQILAAAMLTAHFRQAINAFQLSTLAGGKTVYLTTEDLQIQTVRGEKLDSLVIIR